MAIYSRTEEYASLTLTANVKNVVAGETFKLFVAPVLKSGSEKFIPEATYKLFVQIQRGLKVLSVSETPGKTHLADIRPQWTGGPDAAAGITPLWHMTENEQEKYAYDHWLLATWTTAQVKDTSVNIYAGWTIEVLVDAEHDFLPDGNIALMDATLIVMQNDVVQSPLGKPFTLFITPPGPAFASVTLPDLPLISGQYVIAAGTRSLRVQATLARAARTETLQIRWQQDGAGTLWNQTEPYDVAVSGGLQLADFTVRYDFVKPVTLWFSCAEPGGNAWGEPFRVTITVVSGSLVLENPIIRMEAANITLTCVLNEPSAQLKFARLELSTDGGVHWQDVSDHKAGTVSPYSFSVDITATAVRERDFSRGIYLRTTDNLQRVSPPQPARFDASTFLSATWDGASATLDDINLGESLSYSVHLHCAAGVVLPPATLSLQLSEAAVEADYPAKCWYWMLDDVTGEPKGASHDASGWRGIAGVAEIYHGPLQSGLINAAAHVRNDALLLNKRLPPATLTIDSRDFFVQKFSSTEPSRAQVWRPAPFFRLINPVLDTNKNAVTFRGDFIPPTEPSAALLFTVAVDSGVAHQVLPVLLTTNGFELKLDPAVFTAFEQNGKHSVRLTVRRSADMRAVERSSHSEMHVLTLNTQPQTPQL